MATHIPGEDTTDLRAHLDTTSDTTREGKKAEARAHRFGLRCFIIGIAIIIVAFGVSLAGRIITDDYHTTSYSAQMWGFLGFLALLIVGACLAIIGGINHLQRPSRDLQAQQMGAVIEAVDLLRAQVVAKAVDDDERFAVLAGLVSALPGRVDQLAEHMHTGGAGYLERLSRVEDAVKEIAGHLPDAMLTEHWRGYAKSTLDHEVGRTGTDDRPTRRPRAMGLVPPHST